MRTKKRSSNIFVAIAFGLILYGVYKYQDTDTFQSVMKFLFNPDAEDALPIYWQDNRMVFLGAAVFLTLLYALPTVNMYRKSMQLYKNSAETQKKPDISIVQASFYYQQDKVLSMTAWIIDMCRQGVVSLQYRKGLDPWSVHKVKEHNIDYGDKELLEVLFQNNDTVHMRASFYDPDPDVEETAETLYDSLREKYRLFFMEKQSTFPVWIVLFLLIAEIPFYMASTDVVMPATLPITLFSVALFTVPTYVLCKFFPAFFNGPRVIASALTAFALFFISFGWWMLYSTINAPSFWATAFYPGIVAALLVMLYQAPSLQRDNRVLSQIIGYRKHLAKKGYRIQEEDLPWTLGLGIHSDIFDSTFEYGEGAMPEWLQNNSDDDVQTVMKALHYTFPAAVNKAVNGEVENRDKLNTDTGRDFDHEF